jgi:hypothetical protein
MNVDIDDAVEGLILSMNGPSRESAADQDCNSDEFHMAFLWMAV